MTKKRTAVDELRSIDDAIERSILDASAEELRDELAQDGLDWDKLVAETDALIADSKSQAGRLRLSRAREELKAFQAKPAEGPVDRAGHRTRLNRMRAGAKSGVMMAARKGKHLSEQDEEGAVDDLELLRRLEADNSESS